MNYSTAETGVGEILRLIRISQDLSISELSKKTKISKSYITEIEKGVKMPSEKTLKNYSNGLNISENTLDYLIRNYSHKHLPYQKLLIIILKKIVNG